MPLRPLTIHVSEDQLAALDAAALAQHRDRADLVTEAVDDYLALDAHHRELIEEGLRQEAVGDLIDHEVVRKMVADRFSKAQAAR